MVANLLIIFLKSNINCNLKLISFLYQCPGFSISFNGISSCAVHGYSVSNNPLEGQAMKTNVKNLMSYNLDTWKKKACQPTATLNMLKR